MRTNTSCYYAIKRKGGERVLVTAMNRKECSSTVDYIRLIEPVTDPKDLAQAEKDGKAANKILSKQNERPDGKHRRRTSQAVMVDPGLADPVSPEPEKKSAPPSKPKVLTPKQEAARKAARKKAADKKKAAREQSAKDEAAAAE